MTGAAAVAATHAVIEVIAGHTGLFAPREDEAPAIAREPRTWQCAALKPVSSASSAQVKNSEFIASPYWLVQHRNHAGSCMIAEVSGRLHCRFMERCRYAQLENSEPVRKCSDRRPSTPSQFVTSLCPGGVSYRNSSMIFAASLASAVKRDA